MPTTPTGKSVSLHEGKGWFHPQHPAHNRERGKGANFLKLFFLSAAESQHPNWASFNAHMV